MSNSGGDPFYNRKPVPDEFLEHVGPTGLSATEADETRERKYSATSGDIRKFSGKKKGWHPSDDPYYGRKPVPDSMIQGIGETGLSKQEEFENRERKFSIGGSDLRKFSDAKGGFHPSEDPYYGRKAVNKAEIDGVGETGQSAAEAYEVREEKASMFDLSGDPFQQVSGRGHRASVSGIAGPAAADARRRSSAVAPDIHHHQHSGYDGDEKLAPIASHVDGDEIRPSTERQTGSGYNTTTGPTTTTTTSTTTATHVNPASNVQVRDDSGHHTGTTGHTAFYDAATRDLDNIGPHDRV